MRRTLLISAIIATLCVAFSPALRAQVVSGQVVDSLSSAPLGAGFVVLLDQSGREVNRTLTDRDGEYRLRAPRPGTYRLRSERLGYLLAVSPPFTIRAGSTHTYRFEISPVPFVLSAVQVHSETECEINPERAAATAVVWEEIRKALAGTVWDGTQQLARYRLYNYEREVSANRRRVTREAGEVVEGVADQPYASLPAARLAREGYIAAEQGQLHYALPDANVLLDDTFLSTHCFHVVRDTKERPGQVGLAFFQVRDRRVPDVRGALWLDESTSELRTLEVSYTRLPADLQDERAGGTVQFLRLPSGAWIVQRWELRTPIIRVQRGGLGLRDRGGISRPLVTGWRDFGGEVLEVSTADDRTIHPASLAHVTGTVYDSTRAGAIAGVTVALAGTKFSSTTDTAGAFHIAVPLEGEHALALSHPWLDSIAYSSQHKVDLARGSTQQVAVAVPRPGAWLEELCPDAPESVETGAVVGVVYRPDGRTPAAHATVTAWWQTLAVRGRTYAGMDWEETATTDEAGRYLLCHVPTGLAITIHAALDGDASRTAHLILPTAKGRELLFAWERIRGEAYRTHLPREHPLWTVNFDLAQRDAPPAAAENTWLSGRVTDEETGRGVDGVTVVLNGRDTTMTRSDGTFDLVGVEFVSGVNLVALARLGYREGVRGFTLGEGQLGLELNVSLLSGAVPLEAVEVTGEAADRHLARVGFYERQKVNRGYFLERSDIERLLGRVSHVIELVATLPNLGRMERQDLDPASSCNAPIVFIDGFRLEAAYGINSAVTPEEVYAIELYRTPSQVPPQYGGAESACGVLLVWTGRGG